MKIFCVSFQKQKEVNKTNKESAEKLEDLMIIDFYKDWDSEKVPVMMGMNSPEYYAGELETEDQRKLNYLRNKYQDK